MNHSQEAKYRAAFRSSKETIVAWERRFEEKNGRRPSSSEQTEAVRTCYRNCRKIQAYFKAKSQKKAAVAAEPAAEEPERPGEKQESQLLSFSGLFASSSSSSAVAPSEEAAAAVASVPPSPASSTNSSTGSGSKAAAACQGRNSIENIFA